MTHDHNEAPSALKNDTEGDSQSDYRDELIPGNETVGMTRAPARSQSGRQTLVKHSPTPVQDSNEPPRRGKRASVKPDRQGPVRDQSEPARRLVVELSRSSAADLAQFVEEEEVNKTTIVNRALAVYSIIRSAQMKGDKVLMRDAETGELTQLVLL